MIPLAVPNLTGNERKYLNECIDTTFVSSVGEFVTRLENMVAEKSGAKYAVATSSGTTGLHIALKVFGVSIDELVIIPSFTFIATANAVFHCGAQPWCIDIDKLSWTMSPKILEYELREKTVIKNGQVFHKLNGKRIAAIMTVYTLGMPADMDKINIIAKKYNLPVIADAAAALGSTYKGKNIGDLCEATVFSFNGNKTITSGGGGMIVSNNKNIIDLARHISTTARCGIEYDYDMVGYNYRMTNIQAAVGCAQMERLNEFIDKKRNIRKYYNIELKEIKCIYNFPDVDWAESACWFSGIVLKQNNSLMVNDVCNKLKEKEIEARVFWKPVHLQTPYLNVEQSEMIITNIVWNNIITLPCSTNISVKEMTYVVDVLKEILVNK